MGRESPIHLDVKKICHSPNFVVCDLEEDCQHADVCHPERKTLVSVVPVAVCLRVDALRRSKQMVRLVTMELVLEDEVCGEFDQILHMIVGKVL